MNSKLAAAVALVLGLAAPAGAGEAETIAEIRSVWSRCEAAVSGDPDAWTGWRRDHFNGYADSFQYFNRQFHDNEPSVLVTRFDIDAIAVEINTYCFRPEGSLAFVYSEMSAPNVAAGGENGPWISREGRIYVDPAGEIVRILGWITDDAGKKLGRLDDPGLMLARGCRALDLYPDLAAVEAAYAAELGDIEGNRPAFTAQTLDWCARARFD